MKAEAGIRAVIDTNVWISALLTRSSTPAVVARWIVDEGQAVFSAPTFAELESRLWLPIFDLYVSMEDRKAFLHDIVTAALWVELPAGQASYCRDADDDKFIHTALAGEASWLVTDDQDLLAVPEIPKLRILKPVNSLRLMIQNH